MLDYCRGILDKSFASLVKSADVMWQITCGLDFLHSHKIDPGNLKSKNVLFWKKKFEIKTGCCQTNRIWIQLSSVRGTLQLPC
jgi:hypothetical protein